MANILKIMDYSDSFTDTEIDLDNLANVSIIIIQVLSGDEVLIVHFKDGTVKCWDSSNCRLHVFFDDEYVLYSEYRTKKQNEDMISSFLSRQNSYWR